MNELISVLMPVYNRQQFLKRSIESILNQTYKDIELIIYDDGSTDSSLEILDFLDCNHPRIRVIFGEINKGVGHARNELLKACKTRYAIWMDSDDVSALDRIEKQWALMQELKSPYLIFCGWENLAKKTKGTTLGFATLMFPVTKCVLFNEQMLWGGEDWDWIARMREKYPEESVNEVLYSIDFHGDRIGTWKRKVTKEWGGAYEEGEIDGLSYEETIKKYKKEH